MNYYNKKARQAGMTLIELTVVLLVLVGLAGLMIPYVAGFIEKTHDSTGTWNGAALDSNIQRYQMDKTRLPGRLETLINGAAGTAAATDAPCVAAALDGLYCKLMSTDWYATTVVDSDAGGAPQVMANSLAMAGISEAYNNDPDTDNATFGSALGTPITLNDDAPHTLATVGVVAALGILVEDHMAEAFERPSDSFDSTCYDYVVMGIGDQSDLIGTTLNTAPVHFAQQGTMGPVNKYNRFVAVFQVDKTMAAVAPVANVSKGCGDGMEAAKFVGTAMTMGDPAGHLWGTSHSLSHTWERIAAN